MLQRIQTVYLLIAAGLMVATVLSPLLSLIDGSSNIWTVEAISIHTRNIKESFQMWGVLTFIILGIALPLINIFLFKNRKMQMRVSVITTIILILLYVTLLVYINAFIDKYEATFQGIEYGLIFPFVALIFNILAFVRIKKDDKMVRSLDRIR